MIYNTGRAAAQQKSTASLWVRKQLNKHNPHHIFLLTAWAFSLTNLFINNNYNGPLLLHSIPKTHSRLHCLPTCINFCTRLFFFCMTFAFCCIHQQLYLPFQSANQCRILLRPTVHLAEFRKSWENLCPQAWTRLLHNAHILYLWFVAFELATFGNKDPSNYIYHIRKPHINPIGQISLSVPYAYLDSMRHLWTAST